MSQPLDIDVNIDFVVQGREIIKVVKCMRRIGE
jgi:hypothetical protein